MAMPKHVLVMEALQDLAEGKVLTSARIVSVLGRVQWATKACPITKPFLQPFWAWKQACRTAELLVSLP